MSQRKLLFVNRDGYVRRRRQRFTGEVAVRWWEWRLWVAYLTGTRSNEHLLLSPTSEVPDGPR